MKYFAKSKDLVYNQFIANKGERRSKFMKCLIAEIRIRGSSTPDRLTITFDSQKTFLRRMRKTFYDI